MPSVSVDVALEDLNLLLSDLDVSTTSGFTEPGLQPGGPQDEDFATSCAVVVNQTRVLERALAGFCQEGGGQEGIVEVAVARGMPSPAEGKNDGTAARYRVL